ncbi:MAG: zinc ribbon domain-containing protein [Chloroflexi bacterium]|nr:zinc ribbon domain-containing protein [Chloroflexota bacterium]
MKKVNWLVVGVIGVLALLFLFWGGTMLGRGYDNWRYHGWGMMGPGMMGGWGYSPFGWFGMGLGMLFAWLIPIGIITLIVLGIISLARNTGAPTPPAPQKPCPNCGKSTQADWQNCPYCGTALK